MDTSRLSLFEVESFVRGLQCFPLSAVGSDRWMTQHDHLKQLNLQAHMDAQSKHDEYVVEQFSSQDGRVDVLVHELLVIEAWKEKVFPLLLSHFSPVTAVKAYMVLFHESTICNLLEVLLYHLSTVEAASGDAVIELADYCARKLNLLNSGAFKSLQSDKPEDPKATLSRNTADSLKQQSLDIGFGVAVCAVGLLRFLSDHVDKLPLGVVSRMLHTHDVLLSLVPLVENPPWTRRRNGHVEKYSDQVWTPIAPKDIPLLTRLEAQVWLTLYNLTMDKSCRKSYNFNTHRKEILVKLKKYFNELLMDQLPLLRELKRFIEELSLLEPPPPTASSLAIIETLPEMREQILSGADWPALAKQATEGPFSNDEKSRQRDIARLASTYNLDSMDSALGPVRCGACGNSSSVPQEFKRCSRCKQERYCSRECQVKHWGKHKTVCDIIAKDLANTGAGAAGGEKKSEEKSETKQNATKPAAASSAATTASSTATKNSSATANSASSAASTKPATAVKSTPAAASAAPAKPAAAAPVLTPATMVSVPATSATAAAPTPAAAGTFAGGKIVMLEEMD